ncbi:hypothetical protein BABINDRAFT_161021 [Babjeviella inositovora NRRL Y-12698]|uniref:DNA-directed DNA polymerase n=1 Tax=Babjeviella inositovora NRRL Y-12698 TaxID=984486 RepID=A0A1E3QV29_9ASCO|nr:uncharacterized protein BABINDRAFT_161021 [Babjeviella inositovora NRRL Y-12698]ODQ80817.1 hypothetical protein BABINDRAFT_161021 [Babjeviella inositovora NRRL Y-12698]
MPHTFLTPYSSGNASEQTIRAVSQLPLSFDKSSQFLLQFQRRQFGKQFASLYHHRLSTLRPRVEALADAKWGLQYAKVDKVLDINDQAPCYVVGTVFCDLKYKPNILDDVASGTYGAPPVPKETYIKSDDRSTDKILMEDESGRIVLHSKDEEFFTRHNIMVTGCVAGILGQEVEAGVFEVFDIVYPPLSHQLPRAPSKLSGKVAFVSGLGFTEDAAPDLRLEILKGFLMGEIGDTGLAASITRLFVAGNSIDNTQRNKNRHTDEEDMFGAKQVSNYNTTSLAKMDDWMSELLNTMPIQLMPGESDPVDSVYPQQPWHRSLLPKCFKYVTDEGNAYFSLLSNPTWIEAPLVRMLGTSGENVNDFFKYVFPFDLLDENTNSQQLRLSIMHQNLRWAHLAPTCPDTLWCYPFEKEDPFIMDELPHVYFAGNQPRFGTMVAAFEDGKEVRLISIPKFSSTGEVVVMDLDTLECECIQIVA